MSKSVINGAEIGRPVGGNIVTSRDPGTCMSDWSRHYRPGLNAGFAELWGTEINPELINKKRIGYARHNRSLIVLLSLALLLARDVELLSGINQVGIGANGLLIGIIDRGHTFSTLIAIELVSNIAEKL